MSDLVTLSASKLKTFASCPRKYFYQYIVKEAQPRHPAGAMGTAVHKAIEQVYTEKADSYVAYNEAWAREFTQYPELVADPRTSKVRRDGADILSRYDFAKRTPTEVELEFRLPFPDPIDPVCVIHGFIDHIYDDATIVDLKTSRNRPLKGVLAFDPQFVLYAWAYLNIYGERAEHVLWHHLRTGEDIAADVAGDAKFDNTLRLVDRLLRLHRAADRRAEALERVGKADTTRDSLFDRCIGEACLFCSFRGPCLGTSE